METVSSNQSRTIQTRLVLPPDTNHMETIFGGQVLAYIDEIAAISAMKHCRKVVVTASMDRVQFMSSAKVGHILTLEAFVTGTGRSSMEVYVKVESEDLLNGETTLTTTSFLTMVAKDEHGRPCAVPQVVPETAEEKQLFENYQERKQKRINESD
ncbi:acyl-CoA thioesterase [Thalassobacillus sp. CUG 92003]|uniref:acyl-CoA thioesterase n=1 Tax=Thalassobacillus sp. CUG 92003 TaxID=2736641 RepID=UPI0015E6BC63|nr:acyl-CoA thioesterase [Thalassobacillus sp. CUG 92003]